jgi:hypothetical protein
MCSSHWGVFTAVFKSSVGINGVRAQVRQERAREVQEKHEGARHPDLLYHPTN